MGLLRCGYAGTVSGSFLVSFLNNTGGAVIVGVPDPNQITASLAEAAVVLGSSEETAAALYQALAPYRRSFVTMGAGATVCLGSAARFQGMLAASLQRWDDAERDLEEAVRQNTQAGALPFAAYAEIGLAEVLARRPEKRRALELARSVGRGAARLGMRPLEFWKRFAAAISTLNI